MKIGILTFHFAHNYGAMLQAYALSTKLNLLGFETEIIDYRHPPIYNNHEKLSFKKFFFKTRAENNFLFTVLKTLKNYRKNRNRDLKWQNFELFLNESLKKSDRVFNQDLSKLKYNVFICGSDQIWNPQLTRGLQPIYFAISSPINSLKISYAASNGKDSIAKNDLTAFHKYLDDLDSISVREKGLKDYLEVITKKPIHNVVDPIFLLNREEWESIISEPNERDYILTYSFHEDELFFDILQSVSSKINKKIVRLCYDKLDNLPDSILQIEHCGPKEFLGYFKNAAFVVTNSFHGTAFSILFKKQFYTIPPKQFRTRIDSLLKNLSLSDRIIESKNAVHPEKVIDYSLTCDILNNERTNSVKYLLDAIHKVQ